MHLQPSTRIFPSRCKGLTTEYWELTKLAEHRRSHQESLDHKFHRFLCVWGNESTHGPFPHYVARLQQDIDLALAHAEAWSNIDRIYPSETARRYVGRYEQDTTVCLDQLSDLTEQPDHYENILTAEEYIAREEARMEVRPQSYGKLDYKAIKDRLDITEYIGRTVILRKTGATYKGLCPFHNEKTPSFNVYPATRSYFCFGCREGGDVIDFAFRMGIGL